MIHVSTGLFAVLPSMKMSLSVPPGVRRYLGLLSSRAPLMFVAGEERWLRRRPRDETRRRTPLSGGKTCRHCENSVRKQPATLIVFHVSRGRVLRVWWCSFSVEPPSSGAYPRARTSIHAVGKTNGGHIHRKLLAQNSYLASPPTRRVVLLRDGVNPRWR